jgi:hypothetical protein
MFSYKIKTSEVDAILDTVSDDDTPAHALADLLDDKGDWDWSDDSEHDPCDRAALVESSGAYWCVYRGTEGDTAERFADENEARAALRKIRDAVEA